MSGKDCVVLFFLAFPEGQAPADPDLIVVPGM